MSFSWSRDISQAANLVLELVKNVDVLIELELKPGECCSCQALSCWYDLQ